MSAVLITGCSGAGKSTIAAMLARRGLASLETDDDPFLARFVDPAGAVVECPAAPDLACGAIPVDARQPLDQVVDAIVSRTPASSPSGPAGGGAVHRRAAGTGKEA